MGDGGFSFGVGRSDVTVKMWDADWSFRNSAEPRRSSVSVTGLACLYA